MPTVPGIMKSGMAQQYDETRPTPEQLLITAADMHQRGQLTEQPTNISDPRAPLKLPGLGGGRGPRPERSKSKRK